MSKRFLICCVIALMMASPATAQSKGSKLFYSTQTELKKLESNPQASEADRQRIVDNLKQIIVSDSERAARARLLLAEAYSVQMPLPLRDLDKSTLLYEQAAEALQGDSLWLSFAYANLGHNHLEKGNAMHDSIAFENYLKAAALNPQQASNVGNCYALGLGCDINPTLSLAYYQQSIEVGQDCFINYYNMQYFLDRLSSDSLDENAFGLYRDYQVDRARHYGLNDQSNISWLEQSAKSGYVPAQCLLGTLYLGGFLGTDKRDNLHQAETWLQQAATQDFVPAIYELGIVQEQLYADGNRLNKKACAMAEPYLKKAAEKGFSEAQYRMGIYEEIGRMNAADVDYDGAEFWYMKAAIQGHQQAKQRLVAVQKLQAQHKPAPSVTTLVKKKKTKWWKVGLAVLQGIASSAADISQKQRALTSKQRNVMTSVRSNRVQSGTRTSSASSSNARATENYYARNRDWDTYSRHASALMDMYYGHTTYSDSMRRSRQSSMRNLREKWVARGIGFSQSSWETWSGKCKRVR